ncbi:MAG: ATP-binding protein [Bacteroidota bacterium]
MSNTGSQRFSSLCIDTSRQLMAGVNFALGYQAQLTYILDGLIEANMAHAVGLWIQNDDSHTTWSCISHHASLADKMLFRKEVFEGVSTLAPLEWLSKPCFDQGLCINWVALNSGHRLSFLSPMKIADFQSEKELTILIQFVEKLLDQAKENDRLSEIKEDFEESQRMVIQAQEEAYEKEKLFLLISENTKDLMVLHDHAGGVLYASPSVSSLLGYQIKDLFLMDMGDLIHPEDWLLLENLLGAAAKKRLAFENYQFRARHKKGHYIWVESSIKPILDKNGEIKEYLTVTRDISDRKEAEKQLLAEKNKAEEASKAKSDFLSTMSHEIRTPMNAVIGLSHLLLEENPRPDQLNSLKTLHFSAENLLSLINDILDFSKIEAGKIDLEKRPFNLYEMLNGIHRTFQPKTSDKGISLRLDWDRKIPKIVLGDQVRLAQVLNNLVGNAIKFTEKGGVTIRAHFVKQRKNKVQLYFGVEDTGIGIPEDRQQAIFERFSQASSDTTRKYGGTGLGLSITKRLLELHKSYIQLDSTVGEGSCFYFIIEFEMASDQEVKGLLGRGKNLDNGELKGLRVLVAEDNAVNRMIVGRFLKKWGVDTQFAHDGEEAVDKVVKGDFDLILMDIHMPNMDGLQASKMIRDELELDQASLPIVALTASTLEEDRQKARAAGMVGYVGKPFDPKDLFQKIMRYGKRYGEKNILYRN